MAWRYTYKDDDQVNSHSEEDGEEESERNGTEPEPSQDDRSDLNPDPQVSSTDNPNTKTEFRTPQFLFDEHFFQNSDQVQTIIMLSDDDGSNFVPEEATKMAYGKREMVDAPFSLACRHCFTTFPTAKEVDAHVSKYHPEEDEAEKEELAKFLPAPTPVQSSTNGLFTCQECGKNLSTLRTLREHSRIHTGEKPFSCDYCSSVFGFRANLIRHVKFVHFSGKDGPAAITDFPNGRYTCRTCDQVFSTSANLNKHLKTHVSPSPEERTFPCIAPMCKKRFNDKPSLRLHMSTHTRTGEKSFLCSHLGCGKRFTTKQECVLHTRIQHQFSAPSTATAQGPFICSDCDKVYPSLVSLQIHTMNYHPTNVKGQRQGQGQGQQQRQSVDIKTVSTPVSSNNGMTGQNGLNSISSILRTYNRGRSGQSTFNSVSAGQSRANSASGGQSTTNSASAGQSTTNSIRAGQSTSKSASAGQSWHAGSSNTLRTLIDTSESILRPELRASNNLPTSSDGSDSDGGQARAGSSAPAPVRGRAFKGLRTTIVPANNLRAGIHAINTARKAAGTNTFHTLPQSHSALAQAQAQGRALISELPTFQVGRPRLFWCDEPECNKSYVSAQGLRHHKLMLHSGAKKTPYVCRQCGQGFLRRWVLRAHLRTHSTEKQANFCSLCNESYEKLRAHIRSVKHVEKLKEAGVAVGAGGQMEVKAEADMDDEWLRLGQGEGDDNDSDMDDNDDEFEGEGDGQDGEDSEEYSGQGQDDVDYDYEIQEVETDEYGNPV